MSFGKTLEKRVTNGLNVDSFVKNMRRYGAQQVPTLKRAMLENMLHLEGEAKKTAPFEEGTLTAEIEADRNVTTKIKGGQLEEVTGRVRAGGGSSGAYALRQHEELRPAGPMQPGPGTRGKSGGAAGKPGGKYLTRPLFHFTKRYVDHLAKALKRMK